MSKTIGGNAALSPSRGRRIPSVGSGKDKGEDRPNARDLLASVNSASSGASTSWIAFIGTMAYLAVTLGGITHVDLLLDKETTLPFVSVKVPLTAFFVAAPLAFLLVHFGLLLQHAVLSRKLRAFEERLWKEQPSVDRRTQSIRDELHSYSFTQSVSGMPKGGAVDMALRLIMLLTLVVFPLLLLTFFQVGFLPYHSEPITWWHRGMLIVDVIVIVILSRYIARRNRPTKVELTDWWHARSALREELTTWYRRRLSTAWWALSRAKLRVNGVDYGPRIARIVKPLLKALRGIGTSGIRFGSYVLSPNRFVIGLLALFSLCVATLPDTPDSRWVPLDRWMTTIAGFREPLPFCRPTKLLTIDETGKKKKEWIQCPEDESTPRYAFYLTAYLFERGVNATTGKPDSWLGWSRNLIVTDEKRETPRTLRGRDLRYATLDRSNLKGVDLFDAQLQSVRFVETNLNAADLRAARLQDADLSRADLEGADLRSAELQGANLSGASLQNAKLSSADLRRANLSGASLQGADLSSAILRDATLIKASLQDANLSRASLLGASLTWADLQGANIHEAGLQGADLFKSNLRGANLSEAALQAANFNMADLQGADLSQAHLQGAILANSTLRGVDLSGASLQGANLSGASLQGANLSWASIWKSIPPEKGSSPTNGDSWDPVSFSRIIIRPLDKDGREALVTIGGSAKLISDRLAALLETEDDETWKGSDGKKWWCELARQRAPDPAKVGIYLGKVACEDDTDKGYVARRLIERILRGSAYVGPFLETIRTCPAWAAIPDSLKSQLKRAAQQSSDPTAMPEVPSRVRPDICYLTASEPPKGAGTR
jgi:uncharacterized protein YjbI with pentapeptide repeats